MANDLCAKCNGSGEGMTDGSVCGECNGHGVNGQLYCDCCGDELDSGDDTTCEHCVENYEEYVETASNRGRHE